MSVDFSAAASWPTEEHELVERWTAIESGPSVVNPLRIRDAAAEVSPYSATSWSLLPLGRLTVAEGPVNLNFTSESRRVKGFPEPYCEAAKRICWLMLNEPTPDVLLESLGRKYLEWPSARTVTRRIGSIRTFITFAYDTWGVTELSHLNTDAFEEYRAHARDRGMDSQSLQDLLFLPALAIRLPLKDRSPEMPWTTSTPALKSTPRLGNATEVVPHETMVWLLTWSKIFVQDLAPDVTAGILMKRRLLAENDVNEGTTPEGQAKATRILKSLHPIPASRDGSQTSEGNRGTATRYLSAMHEGISHRDFAVAASRLRLPADHNAPQPMPVQVTGFIEGKTWTSHIDWNGLNALHQALLGACLVMTASLTGMRPHELLALKPGCVRIRTHQDLSQEVHLLEEFDEQPNSADWVELAGHRFKGVRDADGQSSLTGKTRSWAGTRSVAAAIAIMEDLIPEGTTPPTVWATLSGSPVTPGYAIQSIAEFIKVANTLAVDLELPDTYLLHDRDDDSNITLTRFRRTIAHNFLYRPNGELILGVNYGHTSSIQGASYASTATSNFNQLVQEEREHYLYDSIENLTAQVDAGTKLSGPASSRLARAVGKFKGTYASQKDLDRMSKDPDMQVYLNPGGFGACIWNKETALCQITPAALKHPDLLNCSPNCGNLAHTDSDAEAMEQTATELRNEAEASPAPLASRLTKKADDLEVRAERHRTKGKAPLPEEDPS